MLVFQTKITFNVTYCCMFHLQHLLRTFYLALRKMFSISTLYSCKSMFPLIVRKYVWLLFPSCSEKSTQCQPQSAALFHWLNISSYVCASYKQCRQRAFVQWAVSDCLATPCAWNQILIGVCEVDNIIFLRSTVFIYLHYPSELIL